MAAADRLEIELQNAVVVGDSVWDRWNITVVYSASA